MKERILLKNLDELEKGFLEKVNTTGLVGKKEYLGGCLDKEKMDLRFIKK